MSINLKKSLNIAAGKVASIVLSVEEALDDFEDSVEDRLELKKDLYDAAKGISENRFLKTQLFFQLGQATYEGDEDAVEEITLRLKDADGNIDFFKETYDAACKELGLCDEDEDEDEEDDNADELEDDPSGCSCCCCNKTDEVAYVYCGKCGSKHPATNAFCTKCGNSLE